jgi:NADPH2:quinone reductase
MRAVHVETYDSIDSIHIREVPPPEPAPHEVRVRVHAAGVGFVDGLKVRGRYQTKDPLPFTPGSEFAGLVDAIGSDATGFTLGQRVFGATRNGALAELICVPAQDLEPMPDTMSFAAAASFRANYLTGTYALTERAHMARGETLLVLGAAGGVGIAAVQIGKLLGARVIAAASTEAKRHFATTHGADDVIDYTQPDWRDRFKDMTDGHGADVIYDPVGGDLGLIAFRTIAWRGRHLVVGFAGGGIPALPYNLPLLKGGSLVGVDLAQISRREPEIAARATQRLLSWIRSGDLTPVVGRVYPFERFRDAFRAMEAREALGKMVIEIA